MNIEELALGDIVEYNGLVCKVIGLNISYHNDTDNIDVKESVTLMGNGVIVTNAEDIKPIKVTAEFLADNVFVYKEIDEEWWHYDPYPFSDVQIGYESDDDMRLITNFGTTNIRVNYVHELQHALRAFDKKDFARELTIE